MLPYPLPLQVFARSIAGLIIALAAAPLARGEPASQATAAETGELFIKHVAPLLETRCLNCHAAAKSRGKLAIDSLSGLLTGGESGPAIVPGKPDESLLLEMIQGDEPAMPQEAPALSAAEVEYIAKWIAAGAVWPEGTKLVDKSTPMTWWSLEPLQRPIVPADEGSWAKSPIDRFVLEALTSNGLEPSPSADRRTLIRRLMFDLHGLPPTPEEVAAFVADPAPDAYEQLVDRLLASPRYGERWARRWLDVVHFGETHGYDKDKRRDHAWPYRDYVISSFNQDKPYARFVREQLAGDALWPDDPQGVIATGFIAAGPWDFVGHVELREGTVEKAKTRTLDRDDMVASAMSTFVSMTVHCARCHDHKFDPIPQADYYALQAVFAGVDRGDRDYPDPARERRRAELAARHEQSLARQAELAAAAERVTGPELAAMDAERARLTMARDALPDPLRIPADAPVVSPTNGYHSEIAASAETVKWVQLDLGSSQALEVIRLVPARPTDFADTPGFGFPRRYSVQVSDDADFSAPRTVADFRDHDFDNPRESSVAFYLDGQPARYVRVTAERLWERTGDFVFALGELQVEARGDNVARHATVTALDSIEGGRWGAKHLVDGFDSRWAIPTVAAQPLAEQLRARWNLDQQLHKLAADRGELAASLVPSELRTAREQAQQELVAIEKSIAELKPSAQVYAAIPREPRPIHVLERGDVEKPLALAPPGALSAVESLPATFALSAAEHESARRVALAEWIVASDNMLAWRSIANRIWHYHFGRGLVDTPNDLGRNGSRPTHPRLLDWLAVEFRDGGQSFKQFDRMLVTSATYRQQALHDEGAAKTDGGNQFLWRANRQRLDAESYRDAVLAVSGKLDLTMGGPSFELFAFKDDHSPRYDPAPLDEPRVWRRTIYRYITRSVPNPFLETLDCPDPSFSAPTRGTTITALQALATLNNSFVLKQAEHFAARLERESNDPAARVDRAYQLAFGREPTPGERAAATPFIERHGLANFCRLLFNANEFLFVD